jgi:putative ABC transport system permease protein
LNVIVQFSRVGATKNGQNSKFLRFSFVAFSLEEIAQTKKPMLRNYLLTAFRNLFREKGTTIINLAGLTLGITCCLVLFLLVRHLSSFDNFHSKRDRIYRVVTESDGNNGKFHTAGIPAVLPEAFKNDFREAEEVTFVSYRSGTQISIPEDGTVPKKYNEERGVTFVEPNFFKIFDRKIIEGSAAKGLDDPNEAIISASLAKKYFGTTDAIGKIVKHDTLEYKITAVMEDAPANTDLPFDLMLSYITIKASRDRNGWNSIWSDEQCYVLLKESESPLTIEARMPAFVKKFLGAENYSNETFKLQPLSQMHFDEDYSTLSYSTASKEMLFTLSAVAIFLIITACINFINLATAEAIKRSKEVGIRKTLGSSRFQLIAQFLGETSMVTGAAMVLSVSIAQLLLNFLNSFLEIELSMNFSDPLLWIFIVGIAFIVSVLSGLYPSFIISGFTPALALKNQINSRSSSSFNLRRSLVVLQFVISQFFIIGTIVLIQQMDFFQKKELGFRKDAVIIMPVPEPESPAEGDGSSKMKTLREELSRLPGVEKVSLSNSAPSSGRVNGTSFYFEGEDESKRIDCQVKQIDGNYIDLYDIKLLAGQGVADGDTATGFVVNEQLVKAAGFDSPHDIIGKRIVMWGRARPVTGVVNNFHTVSLEQAIEPTVLFNRIRGYETISVKIDQQQFQNVLPSIKAKWEAAYTEHIFDYSFLDEQIKEFYRGEERMSILLSIFTSIAIFIGCLGLLGLATFMANQKTKEIGVRKVLGASVESIILRFTREYVKLIAIGFVLAAPLAWFIMNQWLDHFAYKITLGPVVFLAGFGITLFIALITVGYKSLRAAIVNPVNALKYE